MLQNPSRRMKLLDRQTIQSALLSTPELVLEESGQSAVVLNLESLSRLENSLLEEVEGWCRQLPCPVIGLGENNLPASVCADVIVESERELNAMLRRVETNPQAACVLVQVLRAVEHLPPEEGLVVESLGYSTLQSGQEFTRWLTQFHQQHVEPQPQEDGPAVLANRNGDELTLVLNRPQNDNAYSTEMRDALSEQFQLVLMDKSISKVHVSGAGRCFCTGGDLSEFGMAGSPILGHLIRTQISPAKALLAASERYHFLRSIV